MELNTITICQVSTNAALLQMLFETFDFLKKDSIQKTFIQSAMHVQVNFNSLLANGGLSHFLPTQWCYS